MKEVIDFESNHNYQGVVSAYIFPVKLEAAIGSKLYLTKGRKLFIKDGKSDPECVSTLPNPESGIGRLRYNFKTGGVLAQLRQPFTGNVHSVNVWPIDENIMFANANRWIFVSDDGGTTWSRSHELPESSGLRGIMPCGFCQKDGNVYFGEYIFDESANPRIMKSSDLGETWEVEAEFEDVRHIHSVQVDPYSEKIWVTTGDRDPESKIGYLEDGTFQVVGSGDQIWRTVQPLILEDSVVWGTDSPYKENKILKLRREEVTNKNPEPEILHTETNPFYFAASVGKWIFFSTNASTTKDSTAPDDVSYETKPEATVWGASQDSGYEKWEQIGRYEQSSALCKRVYKPELAANTYVFLATSEAMGLLINPFNAAKKYPNIFQIELGNLSDSVNEVVGSK